VYIYTCIYIYDKARASSPFPDTAVAVGAYVYIYVYVYIHDEARAPSPCPYAVVAMGMYVRIYIYIHFDAIEYNFDAIEYICTYIYTCIYVR